jgi:hypothetical protein
VDFETLIVAKVLKFFVEDSGLYRKEIEITLTIENAKNTFGTICYN